MFAYIFIYLNLRKYNGLFCTHFRYVSLLVDEFGDDPARAQHAVTQLDDHAQELARVGKGRAHVRQPRPLESCLPCVAAIAKVGDLCRRGVTLLRILKPNANLVTAFGADISALIK